ncbi:protoheme IX farnesyltransferase [Ardenticatena maritima]|uniref:Protoheme IX farnesyltransferase n=1 Tax=Ardenticatena maritima TaxID=872965 RepID=A0A0N0RFC3_9CHLR|nr:heme o synthase [Ardenticatena maritima]KPL87673.1 hypothetical protein SE16_08675 [Ardenticatena maritima]GAP62150.1 protoheme IX farnesyltransferase [Ardenticatena maritima]
MRSETPSLVLDRATWKDWLILTKPGVTALLLLTSLTTAVGAARPWLPWTTLLALALAGVCMAGGAAAVNHYFDRDIDALMPRTANRPLPSGRIAHPEQALFFGVALMCLGVAIGVVWLPLESVLCIVLGAIVYILIYTLWLKRRTPLGVVIGGAAGCFPVLAGWAAVRVDWPLTPWVLALLVFFWTPAHFWAYGLLRRDDYTLAAVPVLPVLATPRETAGYVWGHTLLTVLMPGLAFHGWQAFVAFVLGAWFFALAFRLWLRPTLAHARRFYHVSNLYLCVIFALALFGI